jgi:hypothetical protein
MNNNLIKLKINARNLEFMGWAFFLVPPAIYFFISIAQSGVGRVWNDFVDINTVFFIFVLLFIYLVHEILHVIGGMLAGAKINNFKFGFNTETLSIECHCQDEMSLRGLKLFVLLPFLVLTPILAIMAYYSSSHLWWLMLALSTSGCAYDLTLFIGLIGIPDHIRVSPELEGENGYLYVKTVSCQT